MKLSYLLEALAADELVNPVYAVHQTGRDPDISAICYRAQSVKPGDIFVAICGTAADGHDYIAQAVENGAVAIIAQKFVKISSNVTSVYVRNTRAALATLAVCFYGHPTQELVLIGITGTNGKTTVSYLVENILSVAGYNVGVVGTINTRFGEKEYENPVTTPESLDLQRIFRQMVDNGVTHAVMEVSSHALDQGRVRLCAFDCGVFCNLSQDHLDYHGDMESYFFSKKRFFTHYLPASGKDQIKAVINANDPWCIELAKEITFPVIQCGSLPECHVRAETVVSTEHGNHGTLLVNDRTVPLKSELAGAFNLENCLMAVGVGLALELKTEHIERGLAKTTRVPGRLERVTNSAGRHVFVDYAHTPDALKKLLEAIRPVAPARIITVFGCGGDRDRSKRPIMAQAAAAGSDFVVITSDNPRTEDPLAIIEDAEKGLLNGNLKKISVRNFHDAMTQRGYLIEPDRAKAIEMAIRGSQKEDTIVIAGKGHEDYMIIGKNRIDFDDRVEAEKALAGLTEKRD